MVLVIMDRFSYFTCLVPLKDAATSEKTFTISDVHSLSHSIALDQDFLLTSKFWSWMLKPFDI